MTSVNIHAAETNLSRLLEEAAAGAEIIIAKSGKPIARLAPLTDGREAQAHTGSARRAGGDPAGFRRQLAGGNPG